MFKNQVKLQEQILQEWLDGMTIKEISSLHPEYSEITYKRFLKGKPKGIVWTKERRSKMSEIQKLSWKNNPNKEKQLERLKSLSEKQRGQSLIMTEEHKNNIRKHLSSEKMRVALSQSNQKRKIHTPEKIQERAKQLGVALIGSDENSDNFVTVVWPDGVEKRCQIKKFMKNGIKKPCSNSARIERLQNLGLHECVHGDCATITYKGEAWTQYWNGYPNRTTFRRMKKIDQAEQIKLLMEQGRSLTYSCKQVGVDPTSFARKLKLTSNLSQAISSIRCYEKILELEGAEYNKQLKGLQIRPDILIESKKLIIEVDGLYWHTEEYKERNYHHKRAILYESLGYNLLVFSQWEIENRRNIVDSMIQNKLGAIPNKIGARKCEIYELTNKEANEFFEENHLKGKGQGKSIGLKHDDCLICAIRWHKCSEGISVSRFCSKVGWTVNGGYSKLLKQLPNVDIINFVDRRHGSGNHLKNYGFELVHEHVGFEWTNGYESFNRRSFLGSSGMEKGLNRYWDYGQRKYKRSANND